MRGNNDFGEDFDVYRSSDFHDDDVDNAYEMEPYERGDRAGRLRESLFPEDVIQFNPRIGPGSNVTVTSSLVKLYKPAQKMKFAVTNIIDYIEDTDTAIAAAGNLSSLLQSKDPNEKAKATRFVHNLCKKQASRLGLASQPELVRALKQLCTSSNNNDTIGECASSIQHISKGGEGANVIVSVDWIPVLIELLRSPIQKTVESAISALDNVMQFVEPSKEIIRRCHGIERMVDQMQRNDVKFLTVLLNCLHKLTYNNESSKKSMLVSRGSEYVVQILRQYTYEKLLFAASRLMKVLSTCNSNKPVLIRAGAMEALCNILKSGSPRLLQSCMWSIRNLSDHAGELSDLNYLIKRLIELLSSDDQHVAICAIGCLCNLTSCSIENKVAFVDYGGVQAMCQLLCEKIAQEEVVEPGAAALRHVTHNHELANQAVDIILQSPIISNLAVLIRGQPDKMLPLIKALVGLIRNLSVASVKCRRSLIDLGVTESLCEIFFRTYSGIMELSQQRNSIVSISSELSFVEGVRLEDLLELSLSALQGLVKEDMAKKIVSYQSKLLHTVVQIVMVQENSAPLHRAALGLLAEMVTAAECKKIIESDGFNSRLSELIHSTNKAVATYSAIIMYAINANKPAAYRNRLNIELIESLKDQSQDVEDDAYSRDSQSVGSNRPLKVPADQRYYPEPPRTSPRGFENRAFENDFDNRVVSPRPKIAPKKPRPFVDVEL